MAKVWRRKALAAVAFSKTKAPPKQGSVMDKKVFLNVPAAGPGRLSPAVEQPAGPERRPAWRRPADYSRRSSTRCRRSCPNRQRQGRSATEQREFRLSIRSYCFARARRGRAQDRDRALTWVAPSCVRPTTVTCRGLFRPVGPDRSGPRVAVPHAASRSWDAPGVAMRAGWRTVECASSKSLHMGLRYRMVSVAFIRGGLTRVHQPIEGR